MHLPDGFLAIRDIVITYLIALIALAWASKKTRQETHRTFVPMLATAAAFIFAAQMLNIPIAFGTSGHLVGAVLLALLLGPHAGVLAMAIVLGVQAVLLGDGGITTYGANVVNIALLGSFSYYIVRLANPYPYGRRRFMLVVFLASWFSVILAAAAAGVEIGLSPAFAEAGGVSVTLPAMLGWHILIGILEGGITVAIASYLMKSAPYLLKGVEPLGMGGSA